MKKQIRFGVFETNSSSTHSCCITSQEDYDRWIKGELLYKRYAGKIVEKPDNWDEMEDYEKEDYQTYAEWLRDDYLEIYHESHTTPSGDKVVAFGKYGYDG